MQSIFWPSSGIDERYDIKGCLKGRMEDPRVFAIFNELVMKDGNFVDVRLNLGQEKEWY